MIEWYKYQGAGNDFILIDNRLGQVKGDKVSFAKKWCQRRFGIGSDGLILLENSEVADFKMDFYNPDGSQSFCGNGSRCIVAFAHALNLIESATTFEAIDGIHEAVYTPEGVKIAMHQYGGMSQIGSDYFIDTGSPHYLSYCKANDERDIVTFGRSIRYSDRFTAEGTNVNLIEELGTNHIAVRTYERGVENETWACGTGATACGLSYAALHGGNEGVVDVDVKGGRLKIHYTATEESGVFRNIWLEGPATYVFKGEIDE